jgi:uracil-DNA glycosylase
MPQVADDASPWIPADAGLGELRQASQDCRGCDLWREATQTVFGRGPVGAPLMFVGEQPGDREDRDGEPFVGPAGRILDRGLAMVGMDRDEVYITNAVKHFRHEERGKKRIHRKPNLAHLRACAPWIREEIERVGPGVLCLLGATAGRAILGVEVRVHDRRGVPEPSRFGPVAVLTVHPSSIVRERDERRRDTAFEEFVADLRVAIAEARPS